MEVAGLTVGGMAASTSARIDEEEAGLLESGRPRHANGSTYSAESAPASNHKGKAVKPLSLLPLVALIFYDVSGGPFGIEVGASLWRGGGEHNPNGVSTNAHAYAAVSCTRTSWAVPSPECTLFAGSCGWPIVSALCAVVRLYTVLWCLSAAARVWHEPLRHC